MAETPKYNKLEHIYNYLVASGRGFAVGHSDDGLAQAAERDGYDVVSHIEGPDGGFVIARSGDDQQVILIADVYGPWAVDITRVDWR